MEVERAPIWQLGAAHAQLGQVAAELGAAWRSLRDYLVRDRVGLAALFFGVLAFTGWLFTRGSGQDVRSAQRAYGRPGAASLLIALMALGWLAPDPPILFYEALLVLVPIPAAMVARRALPAPIPLTLYGISLATMLIPIRSAIDASAIASRMLLLVQVISIALPVALDLRRGRLQQALPRLNAGTVRAVAWLVMAAGGVIGFHAIFDSRGRLARYARAWAVSSIWPGVRHDGCGALRSNALVSFHADGPVAAKRAHPGSRAAARGARGLGSACHRGRGACRAGQSRAHAHPAFIG
jgi:hypothetical protein